MCNVLGILHDKKEYRPKLIQMAAAASATTCTYMFMADIIIRLLTSYELLNIYSTRVVK